jgi:hypothetical protein
LSPSGGSPRASWELPIAASSEPFNSIGAADLDPLLERTGDAKVVRLGEATHGASDRAASGRYLTMFGRNLPWPRPGSESASVTGPAALHVVLSDTTGAFVSVTSIM